jgi:hypothetical protein
MVVVRAILLFIVISIQAPHVFASPSPEVNALMDEPVSMFDIGMLRLREQNIRHWEPKIIPFLPRYNLEMQSVGRGDVVYNIDSNLITISLMLYGNPEEAACKEILTEYRNIIANQHDDLEAIDKDTWKRMRDFSKTLFVSSFDHVNYSTRILPENWREEFVKIVLVTVGIGEKNKNDRIKGNQEYELMDGRILFCSSPLFSDEVSYEKIGF